MKAREIRFLAEARTEVRVAARWYRQRSPQTARRFIDQLNLALEQVLRWPETPQVAEGIRHIRLRRFPFSVIYRVTPRHIEIIAIAHSSRRPGYSLDQ